MEIKVRRPSVSHRRQSTAAASASADQPSASCVTSPNTAQQRHLSTIIIHRSLSRRSLPIIKKIIGIEGRRRPSAECLMLSAGPTKSRPDTACNSIVERSERNKSHTNYMLTTCSVPSFCHVQDEHGKMRKIMSLLTLHVMQKLIRL